ncbi:MAG: tetratricopeptide repeat protein, partial [Nitrospinota bacterium]
MLGVGMLKGRFFERKKMEAGTMGTVQVHFNDLHYFVIEEAGDMMRLEMVGKQGQATGVKVDLITKSEFAERMRPCSDHDCPFVEKTEEEITKKKAQEIEGVAEEHLKNKEYLSAEFEFGKALKLDEESVKSNYGMGMVYLETGRKEEAKKMFSKLSKIDALFEKENKHLFNKFGIDLRKNGMYDEAIENYQKAISIDEKDEYLYYNLGRAFKEKGDY